MSLQVRPLKWSMIYPGELQAESGFGSAVIARTVNGEAYYRIGMDPAVKVPGGINEAIEAAESTFADRIRAWVEISQ